jgi:hypothetical protein
VTKLTRRSFLQQTSVAAAAIGLLPAVPTLAAIPHSREAAAPESSTTFTAPIVAHVSNVATGEVTLFVGAREVVFRDPPLVARLIRAIR